MIQFNLLPDVKLEFVKANKIKRLVVVVSSIVAAGLLIITLLLFLSVRVVQARHVTSLNNQISSTTATLKNTPNLNQILTIQNQLSALTSLHDKKPVASRLSGYISQLTPATVTISQLEVDFTKNTIQITGTADSLATINQYVDTLKFSTFTVGNSSTSQKAFPSVALTQFGYSTANGASYVILANFDPLIFSGTTNVKLNVPTLVTTRSELDQPTNLFQPQPSTSSTSTTPSTSSSQTASTGSTTTNTSGTGQ